LEEIYLEILTVVGIIATIIGSGIGVFKAVYWYQDRKPNFVYERFRENEIWCLRIQHNDKIINSLSVTMDNNPLHFWDKKDLFERVLRINEGQNFEIGKNIEPNSEIIIKYNRYKIKKKFSKIPVSKDSS